MGILAFRVDMVAVIGVFCALLPVARAAPVKIECPADIPRQSLEVTHPPPGWTPFVPFEYKRNIPLTWAGVMLGPPSKMYVQKPDGGPERAMVWRDLRPEKLGNWMACFYGENNQQDFVLSQRLDDSIRECAATPTKDARGRYQLDIVCR
jgi:hypothetical protein